MFTNFLFNPFEDFMPLEHRTAKINETDDQYELELAATGLKRSDLTIKFQKSSKKLIILGKNDWVEFNHYFVLPKHVLVDTISAMCENGLLKITVKKKKIEKKEDEIEIDIL